MITHRLTERSHRPSLVLFIAFFVTTALVVFPRSSGAAVEGIPCTSEPTDMTIAYGDLVTCQIDPVGDSDVFRFSASAGETVSINAARQSGSGSSWIELFDPEGTRIGWSFSRIDAGLAKTGIHTIRVSEYGDNDTLAYRIDLQCVGQCPSLASSTMTITLTGCATCRAGDVFSAGASVNNPTSPTPRWLEVKSGVFLPDRTPVNLLGNPHLDLPPGFTFDGEVFRMTLPTGLPTGTYEFCGLLLERELGEPLAKSCQTFTIGP